MTPRFTLHALAALVAASCLSTATHAAGGASSGSANGKLIDQAKVLNGGVSAGDAPGFPLTLSEPGLYRLSGNLTVTDPMLDAIQITSDHVTLDLNGFSISGPVACSGSGGTLNCLPVPATGAGVRANGRQVTVRGGVIRGFGTGVLAGPLSRIEDLNVAGIGGTGIAAGASSTIAGNIVSLAWVGIQGWGLIRDNVVSGVRSVGINVLAPGLAMGNAVSGTGGVGLQLPYDTASAFNLLNLNDGGPVVGSGLSLGNANTNLCGAAARC